MRIYARMPELFAQKRLLQGEVAQLVEQRIENPRVGGSIPFLATIYLRVLRHERKCWF